MKEEKENKKIEEQYTWNLKEIFKNREEFNKMKEELIKDLNKIEEYQGKLTESSNTLLEAYTIYEKALEKFEKIYAYGMLYYHLDMSNQEAMKLFKEVESLGTLFETKVAYMTPEITYAKEGLIESYLNENEKLKRYERLIKDILEDKKHILSKEAENLLAKYQDIFGAPENTFDILTNAEFKFGTLKDEEGKEVELTDSNYTVYLKSANEQVRKQAFELMYKKYSEFVNTIAELYLTNVKTSAITSKLRKYKSSLEAAVKNDDASLKVYDSLIEVIHENMKVNHRFIDVKKKLLNKKDFHMYDLYVNPFEQDKDEITFEEAKQEVIDALHVLGKPYTDKLEEAFENRWIDVYPGESKRGGAYSMSVYGIHPYILANFMNTKRDVSTIAHELGHSMHSFYSNSNQTVIDANYTILTAEVASTVNEILLSVYQTNKETDKTKKAELLYELLEMIRATLFRQAMFAEFEKIVHEKIENEEMLSSEDLNNIYYKLNKEYFGNNMTVDEDIKYEWARIPHFYSDFYVYKYSTGISSAIYIATNILKQGNKFVERYINMLKQGCSKKSIDLLKMVDVDLEGKKVYEEAIAFYNEKINELEELI